MRRPVDSNVVTIDYGIGVMLLYDSSSGSANIIFKKSRTLTSLIGSNVFISEGAVIVSSDASGEVSFAFHEEKSVLNAILIGW